MREVLVRNATMICIKGEKDTVRTMMRPITAMMVMKMLGPLPNASVELYEWLRSIEREERVQVRNAEQEEDGGEES